MRATRPTTARSGPSAVSMRPPANGSPRSRPGSDGGRRVLLRERLRRLHPGVSGRTVKQWLIGGRVRVNGEVVRRGDVPLRDADRIELGAPPPPAFPTPLERVWEDDDLIV